MNAKIVHLHRHTPMYEQEVAGLMVSFSVDHIPQEHWAWFCDIVGDLFDQVERNATRIATSKAQKEMRTALGLSQ